MTMYSHGCRYLSRTRGVSRMLVITIGDIIGAVCFAVGIVLIGALFIVKEVSEFGAKLGKKQNDIDKGGDAE